MGGLRIFGRLFALAVLTTSLAAAQSAEPAKSIGCTLRIHVDGLRNAKGNIGTVIYTSPAGWPDDTAKAFRIGPAPIDPDGREGTAVWNDLPPGDYGVAAIHDENSNARLDRNIFGIPREGFGFANNPHVGWGPPPFRAALIHVACPQTAITIHLQYR